MRLIMWNLLTLSNFTMKSCSYDVLRRSFRRFILMFVQQRAFAVHLMRVSSCVPRRKNGNRMAKMHGRHQLWHEREHRPRYRFARATKDLGVCRLHPLLQSNARRNASLVRQEKERKGECRGGERQVAPPTTGTRKHVHHCQRFFTPSSDWFPRVNHRVRLAALARSSSLRTET